MSANAASLQPDECRLLASYIYSICGIQLDESKKYLIESRLRGLLQQTNSPTYGVLYNKARSDSTGALERSIINAITTGETSFFRDGAPFELLRREILPGLIERRRRLTSSKIPIRIWSAACSTGQEVYSLAMILRELPGPPEKYDVRLLGTDISPQAIARASLGVYNAIEIDRGLTAPQLTRYFVRHEGGWKVRDEIRSLATFRTINLLNDFSQLGQFDIVFCRNVGIYFSAADKAALFDRIEKSLASDGCLIIGSTESLAGISSRFEATRKHGAVYHERAGRRRD